MRLQSRCHVRDCPAKPRPVPPSSDSSQPPPTPCANVFSITGDMKFLSIVLSSLARRFVGLKMNFICKGHFLPDDLLLTSNGTLVLSKRAVPCFQVPRRTLKMIVRTGITQKHSQVASDELQRVALDIGASSSEDECDLERVRDNDVPLSQPMNAALPVLPPVSYAVLPSVLPGEPLNHLPLMTLTGARNPVTVIDLYSNMEEGNHLMRFNEENNRLEEDESLWNCYPDDQNPALQHRLRGPGADGVELKRCAPNYHYIPRDDGYIDFKRLRKSSDSQSPQSQCDAETSPPNSQGDIDDEMDEEDDDDLKDPPTMIPIKTTTTPCFELPMLQIAQREQLVRNLPLSDPSRTRAREKDQIETSGKEEMKSDEVVIKEVVDAKDTSPLGPGCPVNGTPNGKVRVDQDKEKEDEVTKEPVITEPNDDEDDIGDGRKSSEGKDAPENAANQVSEVTSSPDVVER